MLPVWVLTVSEPLVMVTITPVAARPPSTRVTDPCSEPDDLDRLIVTPVSFCPSPRVSVIVSEA